jgi:hypothetical protein
MITLPSDEDNMNDAMKTLNSVMPNKEANIKTELGDERGGDTLPPANVRKEKTIRETYASMLSMANCLGQSNRRFVDKYLGNDFIVEMKITRVS